MSEARSTRDAGSERLQAEGTVTPYDVLQSPTGRAGVYDTRTAAASGSYIELTTVGQFTVKKNSSCVLLKGNRVYWDHSANEATYRKVGDRDFYLGRAVEDATGSAPTCPVALNEDPPYDIDLVRDPYSTAAVGTQAVGGFGPPRRDGGALDLQLTATNEAQKTDALSVATFSKAANAIVEFAFRVISDGSGSAADASLGIASATHATDADSIANHLLAHLDANNVNINLQSKDGTTTVAATDTTIDYSEGPALANRVEVWFDMRDPADVQVYVNAALVLPSTVFDLSAAANEFKLLAHLEKTSSTDTYELALDWMRARFAEQ